MPAITDLSKSYGAQTLFREATMTFAAPNCYGVVGANGSGKSTLLKLLARDEEPSRGEISIPKKSRVPHKINPNDV